MRHPLQGLSVPPPEPELRARVLAAAAATARDPRLHWIDQAVDDWPTQVRAWLLEAGAQLELAA